MTNVIIFLAVLAAVIGFRVWLSRFIAADHELADMWGRR